MEYISYEQGVWMKGIQNKHVSILCHRKEKDWTFFVLGTSSCSSWWPSASSITMSIPQELKRVVASRVAIFYGHPASYKQLVVNLIHGRTFGYGTTNWGLQVVGRVNRLGNHGPLKKISIALQIHLIQVTYTFRVQQCTICYTRDPA
jgi:hypothetical protein